MVKTFAFVTAAWVFFRSPSILDGIHFLRLTATPQNWISVPFNEILPPLLLKEEIIYWALSVTLVGIVDWKAQTKSCDTPSRQHPVAVALLVLVTVLALNASPGLRVSQEFIYFQF
jgi:hypothetical protein